MRIRARAYESPRHSLHQDTIQIDYRSYGGQQDTLEPDILRPEHRVTLSLGGDGMGGVAARIPARTRITMVHRRRLAHLPARHVAMVVVGI